MSPAAASVESAAHRHQATSRFIPEFPLKWIALALSLCCCSLVSCNSSEPLQVRSSPPKKRVVLVVFDGLRPDSVNQHDTPVLYALAQRGTTFSRHHPVYLSSTEVNGSAIATGAYPRHTTIIGNREYRPGIELLASIAMEDQQAVRKGDAISNGHYLGMPTIGELVQRAGMRSVAAGSKPVALLHDRAVRPPSPGVSVTLFEGKTLPVSVEQKLVHANGGFPTLADPKKAANIGQDRWITTSLIKELWKPEIPEYSMLWLSEPDFAQHGCGPNSPVARSGLKSSDDNLGRVLKSLATANVLGTTDVIVVSDHGFSTISHVVEMAKLLNANGFNAAEEWKNAPTAGDVFVVGNGGSIFLYVNQHEPAVNTRLVEFLQHSEFAGVIATRDKAPGTFDLSQLAIDTTTAPDIVISLRWDDQKNVNGMPGQVWSEGTKRLPGQGHHASLSRFDMHNTLIAAGPDFKSGFVDELPTGNIDVAPTILSILDIVPEQPLDGRILLESLTRPQTPAPQAHTTTLTATRQLPAGTWRQYLKISQVGEEIYLDEGNGNLGSAVSQSQLP